MRNSILALLLLAIISTGCSKLLPQPSISVKYIQQDINTSIKPKISVDNQKIDIKADIDSRPSEPYAAGPKKIDIYFVYRDGCPACEYMKKVMRRDDIEDLLDANFEITKVNIRDKYKLPKVWMRPFRSPTFYFLDEHKEELISSIHSMSARRFKATLLEAMEARDLK